jgi:hypothetical protein
MTSTHLTSLMGSPIIEVGHPSQCHSLGISPIPLDVSLTSLIASGLVKGLIKSLSDLTDLIRSIEDNLIVNKLPQSNMSTFPL